MCVRTQIIWGYKVYGFQRPHHAEPMLPKRGEKAQRKESRLEKKAASASHNRNKDHGMDQWREAGWSSEHTLKGGKKRTQGINQGCSLHNKVGERMKARATNKFRKIVTLCIVSISCCCSWDLLLYESLR